MGAKRNTFTYLFKRGNKILHGGKTIDPDRREGEHRRNIDSKGHLRIAGKVKTSKGASLWEKANGYN